MWGRRLQPGGLHELGLEKVLLFSQRMTAGLAADRPCEREMAVWITSDGTRPGILTELA